MRVRKCQSVTRSDRNSGAPHTTLLSPLEYSKVQHCPALCSVEGVRLSERVLRLCTLMHAPVIVQAVKTLGTASRFFLFFVLRAKFQLAIITISTMSPLGGGAGRQEGKGKKRRPFFIYFLFYRSSESRRR